MPNIQKKKRNTMLKIFSVLIVAAAAAIFSVSYIQKQANIRQAGYVMSSEINKLQYNIDSRLLNAEILEMIVVNDNGAVENFDDVAEKLFIQDSSIRSLQLAPAGVVSYVYPLKGNEDAFGDLFSDPDRKTEAEYARDTGQMTLAGPFELAQGGLGVVARQPIYLTDESGKEDFWGFSIVILNVPEIFDKADLDYLTRQGYHYKIWRTHPDTGEKQIITESTPDELTDALENSIEIPGGTWMLSLAPKDGWISLRFLMMEFLISLIILTLVMLVLGNVLTISQQKRELSDLANTDPLTGLYNERFFASTIKKQIALEKPFILFYLDLNKFKQVNDQFGHDIGDKFLIEVASRIQSCIRSQDLAFRIGGDEYAVISQNESETGYGSMLALRMRNQISQPFMISGNTFIPEISIGYAGYPNEKTGLEDLIRLADQRMYQEKRKSVTL